MPDGQLTGFRALITCYKVGGESNFAKLVPITEPRYSIWWSARPDHRHTLAELAPTALNAELALHPAYLPLIPTWNAGDLAIVPMAGILGDPLPVLPPPPGTRVPAGIQAHDAFQFHHQYLTSDYTPRPAGWAGVVSDLASPFVGKPDVTRSLSVNAQEPIRTMIAGTETTAFALPGNYPTPVALLGFDGATFSNITRTRIAQAIAAARSAPRHQLYQRVFASTLAGSDFFNPPQTAAHNTGGYAVDASFATPVPTGSNWRSGFWRLARIIEDAIENNRGGLPTRLNVVMSYGDWDTHFQEASRYNTLAGDYAAGLRDFRAAMIALGIWNDVLVWDPTDFGRTLWTNGGRGTDHAWAYPLTFCGGLVRGLNRDGSNGFLGAPLPATISIDGTGPRDWTTGGIMAPLNSIEECLDDVLAWYGMNLADRQQVMPQRGRFATMLNTVI